jgi:hypothetical protein
MTFLDKSGKEFVFIYRDIPVNKAQTDLVEVQY